MIFDVVAASGEEPRRTLDMTRAEDAGADSAGVGPPGTAPATSGGVRSPVTSLSKPITRSGVPGGSAVTAAGAGLPSVDLAPGAKPRWIGPRSSRSSPTVNPPGLDRTSRPERLKMEAQAFLTASTPSDPTEPRA